MRGGHETVERRTEGAFAASPWQDPRAEYRALLRELRERDAAAFDEAVRDYESRVVAPVGDARVDPVDAWLAYGRRLAALAGRGRTVRIDAEGRSADVGPDDALGGPALLLHLPADESAPAVVVAAPREASAAQRATLALLAEGAQAL